MKNIVATSINAKYFKTEGSKKHAQGTLLSMSRGQRYKNKIYIIIISYMVKTQLVNKILGRNINFV